MATPTPHGFLPFYFFTFLPLKKQIAHPYGGNHSGRVCEQAAGDGMACVAHSHAAEIHGENIERGIRGTLEHATQATHERVGTVCSHSVDHHAARPAAGEWLHQRRG